MTAAHVQCSFPELEILEDDDNLKAGMLVLAPCDCGETPRDQLEILEREFEEANAALIAVEPHRPLYHWAPAVRRSQILRYGLRPSMRSTTSVGDGAAYRAPVVCLADSPSWAWALSGGMRWTPAGEWDLWQTSLDRLAEPIVMPSQDRPSGMYEVRTLHRIYKRDLWFVGSRIKP